MYRECRPSCATGSPRLMPPFPHRANTVLAKAIDDGTVGLHQGLVHLLVAAFIMAFASCEFCVASCSFMMDI
jgi:hypothetical protein